MPQPERADQVGIQPRHERGKRKAEARGCVHQVGGDERADETCEHVIELADARRIDNLRHALVGITQRRTVQKSCTHEHADHRHDDMGLPNGER